MNETNKDEYFPKKPINTNSEENIDNEIEILSFLTKRPASHLNARDVKAAQSQVSYLQKFEKQLKVFEDNDIIKKYADEESSEEEEIKTEDFKKSSAQYKAYDETKSQSYSAGNQKDPFEVDYYSKGKEDNSSRVRNKNENYEIDHDNVAEEDDEEEDAYEEEEGSEPKIISHQEFTSLIDTYKSKAMDA